MKCKICEMACDIYEHSAGRCKTYKLEGGKIIQDPELGYLGAFPVSIETIPMLHYYPAGKFLQVFSTGCNFKCPGCIARLLATRRSLGWSTLSPDQVIETALKLGCKGIVSTLNDPSANYYMFRELALKAREKGLLVGCSTNCYFTEETIEDISGFVNFMNVGIKGYSDDTYRNCGVPSSKPVFRNIGKLHRMGVHIEVSAVYLKGNEEDVIQVAKTLANISTSIPLQVMRFLPFGDAPITLEPSIGASERLCNSLHDHLEHVYLFNSPGTGLMDTFCPECGEIITEREFYGPMGSRLLRPWTNYTCECGHDIPVTGTGAIESFSESGFMGGYRISRAFGMVHAVLTCLGIPEEERMLEVWKEISSSEALMDIHHMIQNPTSYLEYIRLIADKASVQEKGEDLISFISKRLEQIEKVASENDGGSAYYCMGSPLFALNAGRMENNLVNFAGGQSINKLLQKEGKPGFNIEPGFINDNNPKTIFISGFLSRPLYEFYGLCKYYGIEADAVKQQRIYALPPSWDFGSPRWILGLLYIADKLHPGKLGIDVDQEANTFYRRYYGIYYSEAKPNRSFHRPSSGIWPREVAGCTHA